MECPDSGGKPDNGGTFPPLSFAMVDATADPTDSHADRVSGARRLIDTRHAIDAWHPPVV